MFDDERFEETGSYSFTVVAEYEAIEYTITFVDRNGNVFGDYTFTVETDPTTITAPAELPYERGYITSWPTFELFDDERFWGTGSYNLTVVAEYEAIEYTITFVDRNGNVFGAYTFTVETDPTTITAPAELPYERGYISSWPTFELFDEERFEETDSYDLTVVAEYETIEYTITFVDKNGVVFGAYTFTVETDPTTITVPTELPYERGYITSWPTFELFDEARFEETGSYDLTVAAVYEAIEYTITFVDKNGVVFGAYTFTVETDPTTITAPATIPTAIGYNVSWPTFELFDDERFEETGSYDLTVVAVYEAISYTVTFRVDGTVWKQLSFTIETMDTFEWPEVPAKRGYNACWSSNTLYLEDITVDAVYTVIKYKVVFIADGLEVGVLTYTVEDNNIKEPPVPKKAGYVGVWEEYVLDIGDKEVYAIYTPVAPIEPSTLFWWIVLGTLVVAGGASVTVSFVKTKKKASKE